MAFSIQCDLSLAHCIACFVDDPSFNTCHWRQAQHQFSGVKLRARHNRRRKLFMLLIRGRQVASSGAFQRILSWWYLTPFSLVNIHRVFAGFLTSLMDTRTCASGVPVMALTTVPAIFVGATLVSAAGALVGLCPAHTALTCRHTLSRQSVAQCRCPRPVILIRSRRSVAVSTLASDRPPIESPDSSLRTSSLLLHS